MREVQGNSKTGYLAVHQLLSHCQAFSQLYKEKKKKIKRDFKEREPNSGLDSSSCSRLLFTEIFTSVTLFTGFNVLLAILCL